MYQIAAKLGYRLAKDSNWDYTNDGNKAERFSFILNET